MADFLQKTLSEWTSGKCVAITAVHQVLTDPLVYVFRDLRYMVEFLKSQYIVEVGFQMNVLITSEFNGKLPVFNSTGSHLLQGFRFPSGQTALSITRLFRELSVAQAKELDKSVEWQWDHQDEVNRVLDSLGRTRVPAYLAMYDEPDLAPQYQLLPAWQKRLHTLRLCIHLKEPGEKWLFLEAEPKVAIYSKVPRKLWLKCKPFVKSLVVLPFTDFVGSVLVTSLPVLRVLKKGTKAYSVDRYFLRNVCQPPNCFYDQGNHKCIAPTADSMRQLGVRDVTPNERCQVVKELGAHIQRSLLFSLNVCYDRYGLHDQDPAALPYPESRYRALWHGLFTLIPDKYNCMSDKFLSPDHLMYITRLLDRYFYDDTLLEHLKAIGSPLSPEIIKYKTTAGENYFMLVRSYAGKPRELWINIPMIHNMCNAFKQGRKVMHQTPPAVMEQELVTRTLAHEIIHWLISASCGSVGDFDARENESHGKLFLQLMRRVYGMSQTKFQVQY